MKRSEPRGRRPRGERSETSWFFFSQQWILLSVHKSMYMVPNIVTICCWVTIGVMKNGGRQKSGIPGSMGGQQCHYYVAEWPLLSWKTEEDLKQRFLHLKGLVWYIKKRGFCRARASSASLELSKLPSGSLTSINFFLLISTISTLPFTGPKVLIDGGTWWHLLEGPIANWKS